MGNFGGSSFFDYTAFGDTVNIAARLEGANKAFGGHVCVSGATAERATDHRFRPVGNLILSGKTKPVAAFEPVSIVPEDCAPLDDYLQAYRLLDGNGDGTKKCFRDLAKRYPDDYLVKYHLQRLASGETGATVDLSKGPKL